MSSADIRSPAAPRTGRGTGLTVALVWLLVVIAPLPIGAAGTSAGLHILVLIGLGGWLLLTGAGFGRQATVVTMALVVLLMHFGISSLMSPCGDLLLKSGVSLIVVLLLLASLAVAVERSTPLDISRHLRWIVGLVVLSVLLDKTYLLLSNASPFLRPSGIYSEPSHLALSLSPVLAALIAAPRRIDKVWGWGGAIALFVLSASATLFLLLGLCLVFVLLAQPSQGRSVRLLMRALAAVVLVFGLVMASPYRDDFVQRVVGLGEISVESNVSSLIYLNGWQTALQNLESSRGLGVGLNRMGCEPRPVTDVTDILEFFELGDSNYNDGSFTVAKLLSEFGVAGMMGLLLMLGFLLRALGRSRRQPPQQRFGTLRALMIGSLVVFTLGAFIRGTGYFSGPFIIGIWAWLQLRRTAIWEPELEIAARDPQQH